MKKTPQGDQSEPGIVATGDVVARNDKTITLAFDERLFEIRNDDILKAVETKTGKLTVTVSPQAHLVAQVSVDAISLVSGANQPQASECSDCTGGPTECSECTLPALPIEFAVRIEDQAPVLSVCTDDGECSVCTDLIVSNPSRKGYFRKFVPLNPNNQKER